MIPNTDPAAIERRSAFASPARCEQRGDSAGHVLVGHAAVFDQWTTLYESNAYVWREVIRPGAFANALREAPDVPALWNHRSECLLGRTTSGTCRVSEDSRGLAVEIDLPDTTLGRDLATLMDRGDVSRMSFAFVARAGGQKVTIREENGRVIEERELTDLDLYDVSPVTTPAYDGTDCALRDEGARRAALASDRRKAVAMSRRAMALKLFPVL